MLASSTLPPFNPKVFLLLGVMSFAFGAILIRYSQAPALAIAFYRLFFATAIMSVFAVARTGSLVKLGCKDFVVLGLNGLVLALHFALWISSLKLTTVAASVILVDTSPFFALIFAYVFLREGADKNFMVGLLMCFVGTTLIFGTDLGLSQNLYGDILSIMGAVLAGFYFFVGRKARSRIDFVAYVTCVYGFGAFFLLLLMLAYQVPLVGYSQFDYLIFLLLAAGPSCLGHNSYNYSLKYMKASTVSATVYGEALGSMIFAIILLNETPTHMVFFGAALIMVGLYIAVIRQRQ
ncbi:MAG: DMT family transporter [Nitrososphaeria archaeon]